MKRILIFLLLISISYFSESQIIVVKFTATFLGAHVDIDSVKVTNLSQPGDTAIYWPDTSLVLGYLNAPEVNATNFSSFDLQLASENPIVERAVFQVTIPIPGKVSIRITDISGRELQGFSKNLQAGKHSFWYLPAQAGVSLVSASFESELKSLKVIYNGGEKQNNTLIYNGLELTGQVPHSIKSTSDFSYFYTDSLKIEGWYNGVSEIQLVKPWTGATYQFKFNYCPGLTQIIYGGQVYHTVQIGPWCWMKENLNIGIIISDTDQTDNGIMEKYCYNDNPANCLVYGGLYQWNEMMQYSTTSGTQGICPAGWHLPTETEWCDFTTYLDPIVECFVAPGFSGNNVGAKMKEHGNAHWNSPNPFATNESGFSALGTGSRDYWGDYSGLKMETWFWSSTISNDSKVYVRMLYIMNANIYRAGSQFPPHGSFSVRCLMDF